MVNREVILKAFDDILTVKCNDSSKARAIGETAVLSTKTEGGYSLSYGNGMTLEFDENNNMVNLSDNSHDYNYIGADSYKDFEYQKQELMESDSFTFRKKNRINSFTDEYEWETFTFNNDYEFLTEYATNFATVQGLVLNRILSDNYFGDKRMLNSFQGIVQNKTSHDHFVELERNTRCDHRDYVTLRIQRGLHESDNINKEHYRNKQHTSMSVGGDSSTLMEAFNSDNNPNMRRGRNPQNPTTDGNDGTWRIYTKVSKDSGVHGLFLGNNINDSPSRNGDDWEVELNLPPNTKFVRDVIDEKNHIIIQHIEP